MVSTSALQLLDTKCTVRDVEAEAFFDALRAAQTRFLDTMSQASAQLGQGSGQLAFVAATHRRLTRQFFDAQRSLMLRRADIDAEVARIGRAAEEEAIEIVAEARSRSDASGTLEISHGEAESNASAPRVQGHRSALSAADVEAFAGVVNDAFEPDEPDGVLAGRALAKVLDAWWEASAQEGRAVLDDACARAAVRRHRAMLEVEGICSTAVEVPTSRPASAPPTPMDRPTTTSLVPAQVLEALKGLGSTGLAAMLAELADALVVPMVALEMQVVPVAVASLEPAPERDLVILVDRLTDVAPTGDVHDQAFLLFWRANDEPTARNRSRVWFPVKAAAAMTATSSVLTLLMAWVG